MLRYSTFGQYKHHAYPTRRSSDLDDGGGTQYFESVFHAEGTPCLVGVGDLWLRISRTVTFRSASVEENMSGRVRGTDPRCVLRTWNADACTGSDHRGQ